ncbi:hypothetical protein QCA50_014174 [Cerrena zonata]|uniref:DUF302 domain-containing protein n=1 Tax=Cerrena zonata TaxID=2478898 RepID=A0AAW0FV93_9APHY
MLVYKSGVGITLTLTVLTPFLSNSNLRTRTMSNYEVTNASQAYTAHRVTFTSGKHIKDVIALLDLEVNRSGCGLELRNFLNSTDSKKSLEEGLNKLTEGTRDFLFFSAGSHSKWLNVYFEGKRTFPETHIYMIGNPLIAQTMLQHNLGAGLHIPPKILIEEIEGGGGTRITYDSAASTMFSNGNEELREATKALDDKLEGLIRRVLSHSKL